MAYTLVYSGGTITVNDGSLNTTSTSLQLPGRNYAGYGSFIEQNLLDLTENFARSTQGPSNAIKGQIWFDSSGGNLLKYNTSSTVGSPSWATVVTSGIGMNVSFGNVSLGASNTLTTRTITTGSSTTPGTLIGAWNIPAGSSLTGNFVLPTASSTQLGGIKVGSGLSIDGNGILSTNTTTGVSRIIAGTNITISPIGGTGVVTINANTGAGSGSVTSVNLSGGATGLTASGGPITGSGTITLSGVLEITSGGTGASSASVAINNLLPAQSAGTVGAVLTSNGSTAAWVIPTSNASTSGYSTLGGNIIMAWGVENYGDIYSGHDTATISFGGLFSVVYNIQITLRNLGSVPSDGSAYPIVTNTFDNTGCTIFFRETNAGVSNYDIHWLAIGLAGAAGTPYGLNFIDNWVDFGTDSQVTLTGSAFGTAPLQFDWSIDGGATYPITNTNPAQFTISNTTEFVVARMKVRNSVAPTGVTYTRTIYNPNYGGGGPPIP
jgi:hypothetical protein